MTQDEVDQLDALLSAAIYRLHVEGRPASEKARFEAALNMLPIVEDVLVDKT